MSKSARAQARRGRAQGRSVKAHNPFVGHKQTRLAIEPPQFNSSPMYPLTIEIREPYQAATAYNLTPAIVANKVRQQFGGITGGSMVLRMKSIQMYAVQDASSVAAEINADISNLSPQLDDNASPTAPIGVFYGIAAKLKDVGTLNRPAKIGWVWSTQDQHRIISESTNFEIATWAVAGTATSIIRVHIDFGYAGTAAPQGP